MVKYPAFFLNPDTFFEAHPAVRASAIKADNAMAELAYLWIPIGKCKFRRVVGHASHLTLSETPQSCVPSL